MNGATIQTLKLTDPFDLRAFSYAEWIVGDYMAFIKSVVMPVFTKTHKLKLREIRVLTTILISGRNITASEIAEFLRQDPATITRCMVVLIGKGYAESSENYSDGRSRILALTDSGKEAAQLFIDIFDEGIKTYDQTVQYSRSEPQPEDDIVRVLDSITLRVMEISEAKREIAHRMKKNT